jgi:hydroxylaminobenzene mutase
VQRDLFRHAFVILFVAFVLGVVAGVESGRPTARLWLGAHMTGILVGLLLVAVGVVWPHLRLSEGQQRWLFRFAVIGNWIGVIVLGAFGAAIGAPAPIVAPGLPSVLAWQQSVISGGIAVVTITTFATVGLVLVGLRGEPPR